MAQPPIPINGQQCLELAKDYADERDLFYRTPTPLSAAATLTAAQQAQGVYLHNTGAVGATVFVLAPAVVGDRIHVAVRAAQALTLDLPVGGIIDGVATTGQTYTADAIGEFLILHCFVAGAWSRLSTGGTWTAA